MRRLLLPALFLLAAAPSARAATGAVTQFPIPGGNNPVAIAAGPDGNLWTTQTDFNGNGNKFAVMGTDGVVKAQYATGLFREEPFGISAGPDGNLWYTNTLGGKIGRMTPAGTATTVGPGSQLQPYGITGGPDGNLWVTQRQGQTIARITPGGTVTRFPAGGALSAEPNRWIVTGADGNLWFTEDYKPEFVGRMTPAGVLTEFPLGSGTNREPTGIAAGPDGNLWVAERFANDIVRVTPSGQMTHFPLPTAHAEPFGIVTGSDGNVWFAEQTAIGRITPSGTITEFPTGTLRNNLYLVPGADGNLWMPGNSRVTVAKPGVGYVLSMDGSFQPARRGVKLGGTVQWTFYGPRVHRVADASGMNLFDSGPRAIVSSYSRAFTAAGLYSYRDPASPALSGSISVPLGASPASGSPSTAFTVTSATNTADAGYAYDVQIRRPGSPAWVAWRTGTTAPSAGFVPDAGAGTYSFRSRLRNTGNGNASGWSASKTIAVS